MEKYLPKSLRDAISEFGRLPGIGPKTAARLVFFLLSKPAAESIQFGETIKNLHAGMKFCERCGHVSEKELCLICQDKSRNQKQIAVVEEPLDVVAFEKTGQFRGVYHVLGGVLNPIEGVTPEFLRIDSLIARVQAEKPEELIIALDPSLEGEATAIYINQRLEKANQAVKVTRIARGLPVGGDVEFADEMTLLRALEGRQAM